MLRIFFYGKTEHIYLSKRSYRDTPTESIQNTEGDQKPIQKKGLKQKQTSPLDELENTQNQCYKYDCINKKFKIRIFKIKIQ